MKFKFILILLLIFSCTSHTSTLNQKNPYTAKGFAYIYNDLDYNKKIIKGKMNNQIMQLSHQNLKTGSLIKITNPINNKTLVEHAIDYAKNSKLIKHIVVTTESDEVRLITKKYVNPVKIVNNLKKK